VTRIDLNCDLGEGFGHDAELMTVITSANIACGGHAGDDASMRTTVELARRHGVAIGAHPGFEDRDHFGRRELALSPEAVVELVLRQVARLRAVAGGSLCHVKLHGALYNLVSRESVLAAAVTEALRGEARDLAVFALAGSEFERCARARGLRVAGEGFADRTYQADGTLTPRSRPDALLTDESDGIAQVLGMVREGRVRTRDGRVAMVTVDTVCLHGDGAQPVALARRLRAALDAAGVLVRAFGAC
jgi:UPF0271 protein